jgi:hypothetical protein
MSVPRLPRAWTEEEVAALVNFYVAHLDKALPRGGLRELATKLDRDFHNVCRKARRLGLTRNTRPMNEHRIAEMSADRKKWHQTHEHPRGALGHRHDEATLRTISKKVRAAWDDPESALNSDECRQKRSDFMKDQHATARRPENTYSRCLRGRRDDLGDTFFRSSWEANYARYLNLLKARGEIVSWSYECRVFEFHEIKRGTRSYMPDFLVVFTDGRHEWHEVKGWMDDASRLRLARMAQYYPDEKLVVVDKHWFASARRSIAPAIPNWEHGKTRTAPGAA